MKRRIFLMGTSACILGSPLISLAKNGAGDQPLMIFPYQGVGPIRFGMKRSKVRRVMKKKPDRNNDGRYEAKGDDIYTDLGLRIHYGLDQICEAITISTPAEPRLGKKSFLGRPAAELLEEMRLLDPALNTNLDGWTCMKEGITVNAPKWKTEPEKPVGSMLVFAEGYYTNLFE